MKSLLTTRPAVPELSYAQVGVFFDFGRIHCVEHVLELLLMWFNHDLSP